jgi:hypothetical protein
MNNQKFHFLYELYEGLKINSGNFKNIQYWKKYLEAKING